MLSVCSIFFVGCSLCPVNICYTCASSVQRSVCVHYSFGNIRLIDPFYVSSLFVATGPCSLHVRSYRTQSFCTRQSPLMCDRSIMNTLGRYRYRVGKGLILSAIHFTASREMRLLYFDLNLVTFRGAC